jgi:hypothetical protein
MRKTAKAATLSTHPARTTHSIVRMPASAGWLPAGAAGGSAGAAPAADPLAPSLARLAPAQGASSALQLAPLQQKHQALRRNFPVLIHIRYFLESIRPEIQQYLIESDNIAAPFSREARTLVYNRSKGLDRKSVV